MVNKRKKQNKKATKKKARSPQPIPVTILSGFLGSGKTTLLKHILTSKDHGLQLAVIVNDMSELNIDGYTISKTKKEVVTLENGCICCTLRGDLIKEINSIQDSGKFDYVLIESTGVAEPQQVAESFCVDPETQALATDPEEMLWNVARLDTCVSVVDTVNFASYISSLDRFADIFEDGLDDKEETSAEGAKSISELMVEQVEFANVILLNKIDLVTPEQIKVTKKLIQTLNPKARVIEGSFGKVNLHNILNTGLFDMKEAEESRGWLQSLEGGVNAAHGEADEYGVTSFVYRARKPFHPYRLSTFLKQFFCFAEDWVASPGEGKVEVDKKALKDKYGSILRSKGMCWIAGRDNHEFDWAQSGRIIQINRNAFWYCETPEEEWDADSKEDCEAIRNKFDGEYGDRRQEVVFIGIDMKQGAIKDELSKCLLSDEEMMSHNFNLPVGTYPDPLRPLGLAFDGAESMFLIARQGQNHHIRVLPGGSLTVQNVALNIVDEESESLIRAVKVWLDTSDVVKQGTLISTLRPGTIEQHSMSLTLLPCQQEEEEKHTFRRIRIEIVPRTGASKTPDEWLLACEVHVMGKIEPLPFSEDNGDHSDEEMEEEEEDQECTRRGSCPYQ